MKRVANTIYLPEAIELHLHPFVIQGLFSS